MLTVETLTPVQREQMITKACGYRAAHKLHVKSLEMDARQVWSKYPPEGSDLLKPELWKAAHWLWFFEYLRGKHK